MENTPMSTPASNSEEVELPTVLNVHESRASAKQAEKDLKVKDPDREGAFGSLKDHEVDTVVPTGTAGSNPRES
jgi:hypothetical protein